jgi:peptide-methionine (S)-S-oxide reductase
MATRPRRHLPANPSHEHLRKQAKRLAKSHDLQLAVAQRRLAADYGYPSWAALMRVVDGTANAPAPSPLAAAAARADAAAVRDLLARGEPPNGHNSDVNTPLWHACASDAPVQQRIAVVTLLLDAGASPRQSGDGTPLHQAARRGPLALVELLIRRGALGWQPDRRGKTALDHARKCSAKDRDAIIELLDRPVIRDPRFREAVKAIHSGNVMALSRLLDRYPDLLRMRAIEPDCYPRDNYFRDPKLFWFIANNPTLMRKVPATIADVARVMIARGVEQADLDHTLTLAMSSGSAREDLLVTLIDAGAVATPEGITVTLAHLVTEPIELLLARGLPMTAPIAAALGRTDVLRSLLPAASPDDRQEALGLAVINRQAEAARQCLDAGADPNQPLPVHRHAMPLHTAALSNDIDMMKLLVERGARIDARDTLWDGTPLGWALHNKKAEAAAYLRSLPGPG